MHVAKIVVGMVCMVIGATIVVLLGGPIGTGFGTGVWITGFVWSVLGIHGSPPKEEE